MNIYILWTFTVKEFVITPRDVSIKRISSRCLRFEPKSIQGKNSPVFTVTNVFVPSRTFFLEGFFPINNGPISRYLHWNPSPRVSKGNERFDMSEIDEEIWIVPLQDTFSGKDFRKRGWTGRERGWTRPGSGARLRLRSRNNNVALSRFSHWPSYPVHLTALRHVPSRLPRPSAATLLHPSRPPNYGEAVAHLPLPRSFSLSSSGRNTVAVTATVIAFCRRYMYAVHPCPPPLSVTQRARLPDR